MDSFSPNFKTVYVTDSESDLGEYGVNLTTPATIYAFDVINQKYLRNWRMFAYSDNGIPDGIHTDAVGNVWRVVVMGFMYGVQKGCCLGSLG
jgi:gluconolactonase